MPASQHRAPRAQAATKPRAERPTLTQVPLASLNLGNAAIKSKPALKSSAMTLMHRRICSLRRQAAAVSSG